MQVTDEGKSWVASLNYHVFSQSHKAELAKSGIELLNEITKINPKDYPTEDFILLILEKICSYKDWPLGHAYIVEQDPKETSLRSMKLWHVKASNEKIEQFRQISEEYVFKCGEGLPGRVYDTRSVQTIFDVTADPNFPRAKLANDIGVRGAFSFPLGGRSEVKYILEFFSQEAELLDPSVLEFMKHVSKYISKGLFEDD